MKAFYSIIKIAPNPLAGDTLAIGLLLHDGEKIWLKYSDERKAVVKKLLNDKGDTIDFITKQIQQKVDELNKTSQPIMEIIFPLETLLTSEQFTHISNYSNGILRFTEPSFLNDNINEEKFLKLFALLIDKIHQKIRVDSDEKENILRATIQTKLISRVKDKVHTNIELTPDRLPGLYYSFNIDCIGLNGSFTAAKSMSFSKKHEAIDKELSHYLTLISILNKSYTRESTNDDFYIIGDEPSEIDSKEHRIWEILKNNPAIKLLYPEQAEKVAEKIEEKNSKTFLSPRSV